MGPNRRWRHPRCCTARGDRYQAELHAALANPAWALGCDSYFRTASRDIVTQIPYTTNAYAAQTQRVRTDGFDLGATDDDDVETRATVLKGAD